MMDFMDRGANANLEIHKARQSRMETEARRTEGKPEKQRGLYMKYEVTRVGKPDELVDCIVMSWDDPLAREAIHAFAKAARREGYHALASDLFERLSNESGR